MRFVDDNVVYVPSASQHTLHEIYGAHSDDPFTVFNDPEFCRGRCDDIFYSLESYLLFVGVELREKPVDVLYQTLIDAIESNDFRHARIVLWNGIRYNVGVRAPVIFFVGIIAAFAFGFYLGRSSPAPETASTTTPAFATATTKTNTPTDEWYPVVKVIDGDTFVVAVNSENITVRLIGLDTPETVDPRKPVQCFGHEASEKAKQILAGSSVRLETDPSQGELDKYGRLLAYAFLENRMNVAEYMIVEGYGHEYTYNLPYKYQADFKAAEDKARADKRGLWADGACSQASNSDENSPTSNFKLQTSGTYECSRNAYNCGDFATQAEAQSAFESCGGSGNDVHKLDADDDGSVCESLP